MEDVDKNKDLEKWAQKVVASNRVTRCALKEARQVIKNTLAALNRNKKK